MEDLDSQKTRIRTMSQAKVISERLGSTLKNLNPLLSAFHLG